MRPGKVGVACVPRDVILPANVVILAASFKLAAAVLRTACSGVTGVEHIKSAAIASMFAGPPEL